MVRRPADRLWRPRGRAAIPSELPHVQRRRPLDDRYEGTKGEGRSIPVAPKTSDLPHVQRRVPRGQGLCHRWTQMNADAARASRPLAAAVGFLEDLSTMSKTEPPRRDRQRDDIEHLGNDYWFVKGDKQCAATPRLPQPRLGRALRASKCFWPQRTLSASVVRSLRKSRVPLVSRTR